MKLIYQHCDRGYLRDILDQPRALDDTLAGLRLSTGLGGIPERLAGGGFRRIVLTGMGSSYHALHPLFLQLVEAGHGPIMVETSELIHPAIDLIQPETLLIAVSQSGRSVEILRLIENIGEKAILIAVTNSADSPLAQSADQVVLTRAGSEFTVSCKTYQTALMALSWAGNVLCKANIESGLSDMAGAADAVSGYLALWEQHVGALFALMKSMRHLFFVGRGSSLAAVGTGGLITKESAHVHAEGMSSAAFRHGPMEMVAADTMVVVFGGDAKTLELNRRLADDIRRAGGKAALVVEGDPPEAFHLPVVPAAVRPILEILPIEMMTLALAELQGHEAGAFTLGSKITSVE